MGDSRSHDGRRKRHESWWEKLSTITVVEVEYSCKRSRTCYRLLFGLDS